MAALVISGRAFAQDYEAGAIRERFSYLKRALLEQHGKEAAALVDRGTLAYYERMLEEARTYDSSRLMQLPLYERMFVLSIRMQAIVHGTAGMTERPFFIYATDKGLINKMAIPLNPCNIGEITFTQDSATGRLKLDATVMPYYSIKFHYESGSKSWKVNLPSLFTAFSRMTGTGSSDPEYMMMVIAIAYEKHVDASIWKPLVIQ
jgi:hypothetical protein